MRALFIQHDPGARPGLVGEHLSRRGFDIDTLTISETVEDATFHGDFPAIDGYDLIVPLGAIWSLHDHETVGSWIDRELALLREADQRGVPVLGICFGGQALAAAHGGVVEPCDALEVGWQEIDTDEPGLVPPGPWMQWHNDRFSVPPDALELARGVHGPQAFRLRRNLGLQFHPEIDATRVASWIEMGGTAATRALEHAGTSAEQILADCRVHRDRAEADLVTLLEAFLVDVAQLP